jgi:thioredoxin
MKHLTNINYEKFLNEKDVTIFVKFSAVWCGPCKLVDPHFTELSKDYIECIFYKVDVDDSDEVANTYDVVKLPTIVAIRNGEEIGRISGSNLKNITKFIADICEE